MTGVWNPTLDVTTSQGPARFVLSGDPAAGTVLVLGHGAGGGIEAPDLVALAERVPEQGSTCVARFEQPWRTAGRKVAPAPRRLDEAWVEALPQLRVVATGRLVVGGRSAGARVACRTAEVVGAIAVLALSFPLHPPGKPGKSRIDELAGPSLPRLVVQGAKDPFGGANELRAALSAADVADEVSLIERRGAVHDLLLPKSPAAAQGQGWEELAATVCEWLASLP